MQDLFKFLAKYYFVILFMFLELISISLIVQNNKYQKSKFINSANALTGGAYQAFSSVTDFVSLKEQNERLLLENAKLKNSLKEYQFIEVPTYINDTVFVLDTVIVDSTKLFNYLPAKVISNSTNKPYNIVYLNRGIKDGILKDMGVIDADGVVGIVTSSSPKFSVVMPIIHKDFNLSVRLKSLGYFGNLSWDGMNPLFASLGDIPNHIAPEIGDTIVTSGYSNVFPEGIVVGYVSDFKSTQGNGFLTITVELAADFGKLDYVYGIENRFKEDFDQLSNE